MIEGRRVAPSTLLSRVGGGKCEEEIDVDVGDREGKKKKEIIKLKILSGFKLLYP